MERWGASSAKSAGASERKSRFCRAASARSIFIAASRAHPLPSNKCVFQPVPAALNADKTLTNQLTTPKDGCKKILRESRRAYRCWAQVKTKVSSAHKELRRVGVSRSSD